ncbi:SPOR domain-containing protein [Mucilaginibacter terrenus]|uniref:SPOR domain-containing protein n=1 Tax=Mucilaginibacter terrenus TaxID=2482727 RepID=A0A3E2NM94_9SPHI|nr:SPOR domain-containing protein [Mucilaginibacter terrenus]RFZ82137.1 SPOR domain-containing protein [Mucilaginibacter terrenus]
MDVSNFISELLGLHGDVSVPGLGYFAHTRVNGYYDDKESKFYPPGYSVQFDPQSLDDDNTLALYIAEKKNISLASAKYFIEKFVASIKQQAVQGEVALGSLGWLSSNRYQLSFRPNVGTGNSAEFFGYPVISLPKLGDADTTAADTGTQPPPIEEATPDPEYQPQPYYPPALENEQYQSAESEESYLVELTNKRRRKTTWVFVVLALLLAVLIAFLVNRYDPSSFNFSSLPNKKSEAKQPAVVMQNLDSTAAKPKAPDTTAAKLPDTTAKKTDTVAKPTTTPATATPAPVENSLTTVKDISTIARYEVIAGSFRDLKEAAGAILQFKKAGLDAKIVPEAPGKRIKVSVGTFVTRGQAEDNKRQLISSKKVPADTYVMPINPKETTIKR